jgi:Domain of unknown function (DUF427)
MNTTGATDRAGRVRMEQGAKRVRAYLSGEVVADTTRPRLVWEVPSYPAYCLPVEDVRTELIFATATVSSSWWPAPGRMPSSSALTSQRCWPGWAFACPTARPGSSTWTRASTSSASASSGSPSEAPAARRLHLPVQEGVGGGQGDGARAHHRRHQPAAGGPVPPARAGAARLGQLLPPRGLQGDL